MRKSVKVLLLAVLCVVFLFSAFQVVTILREDKQSEDAYSNLKDEALGTTGEDSAGTGQNGENLTGDGSTGAGLTGTDLSESGSPASGSVANGDRDQKERPSTINIATLKKSYPELQAWIQAEGIGIDYPVMQTDNNEYYLDHLYDGSQNANGSLFIDFRNDGILNDDNTVIYGHNMDSGAMFAGLIKYKSQDFYEKNPTMTITTEDGDYRLELIGGTVEDGDYQFVKLEFEDFEEMEDYVADIQERSTFKSTVKLKSGDKLVSLCTCSYESKNARYMLVGVCR